MANPCPDCGAELIGGLPDATEHDVCGIEAGGKDTGQLPGGHDVCACAQIPQKSEDSEVTVGFDGETNAMGNCCQSGVESAITISNRLGVIDERWCSGSLGDLSKRDPAKEERTIAALESGVRKE